MRKTRVYQTVYKRMAAGFLMTALFLLAAFGLFGCRGSDSAAKESGDGDEHKLRVVTTLFPYYDFTRQIAGDRVELTMVIPAGMDSHSFEPTPADIKKIQNADVFLCNGGEMEHWVSQVLGSFDSSGMTVVTMMDYVDVVEEELVEGMEVAGEEHHSHGHDREEELEFEIEYDEHIWTSPVNAMKITEIIAQALSEADGEHAAAYEAGRDVYVKKLQALDEEFRQIRREAKRDILIMGDRFPLRYFADEYDLRYRAAFSGCSSDTEPSARTIAYLIDKVREEKIPAVYYLELSSPRVAEIIGEETGAKPLLFHSCHNVTRKEFDGGVTYLELMKTNAEHLREGLCQ